MGHMAEIGERGLKRKVRFDGQWWTLIVRNDGFSMMPYNAKSPEKIVRRFWREVFTPSELPLFAKELGNGTDQSPHHPGELNAPGGKVQRKRRGSS